VRIHNESFWAFVRLRENVRESVGAPGSNLHSFLALWHILANIGRDDENGDSMKLEMKFSLRLGGYREDLTVNGTSEVGGCLQAGNHTIRSSLENVQVMHFQ